QAGVATALEKLERDNPGAHVYVGSGTHGELNGNWAPHDPTLRESLFYAEDLGTTAAGHLPGLGARHVFNVGAPAGATQFLGAESTAAAAPAGTIFPMPAWCFSTLKK